MSVHSYKWIVNESNRCGVALLHKGINTCVMLYYKRMVRGVVSNDWMGQTLSTKLQ
jgi:hypothetical protein